MTIDVNSQMVNDGEQVNFGLASAATGISASGTTLTFQPGTYDVKIFLPDGFSGDAAITWVNSTGQMTLPTPNAVSDVVTGVTWVEFTVTNGPSTGPGTFFFQLGASQGSDWLGPTVVSDPPPSLVLQS